jgi:Flp pilus assembly protein TadG
MSAMHTVRRRLDDERGVVMGFLVRTVIVFAVVGVALFETGTIMLTSIHAHGAAGAAAQAASNAYFQTHNFAIAKSAAKRAAKRNDPNATVVSVRLSKDGQSAYATVVETAHTLVIQRIGFTQKWGIVHASEQETHASV